MANDILKIKLVLGIEYGEVNGLIGKIDKINKKVNVYSNLRYYKGLRKITSVITDTYNKSLNLSLGLKIKIH